MSVYNWFMTVFAVLVICGLLYLLLSGKAATRTLSKTERVLYHVILLLLFVEIILRQTGLGSKVLASNF